MYGNSFFKLIVIIVCALAICLAVFTVVFNISPIYSVALFIIALILNIIDNIITTKQFEKNMKAVDDQINNYKKDISKKKNRGR